MCAANELELVVAPVSSLCALMRAVANRDRLGGERRAGVRGVEVELDHLPVALVKVVEVVENLEEPVLQRELPGMTRVGRDMGVHGWLVTLPQAALPALVVAPWVQGVAGEVEVVLVEAGDVLRSRGDPHEVGPVPRPAQGNRGLAEEEVDADRPVGLSRAARLGLLDDPHDGRVALGERLLAGVGGARDGDEDEHGRAECGDCCRPGGRREGGTLTARGSRRRGRVPRSAPGTLAASWACTLVTSPTGRTAPCGGSTRRRIVRGVSPCRTRRGVSPRATTRSGWR